MRKPGPLLTALLLFSAVGIICADYSRGGASATRAGGSACPVIFRNVGGMVPPTPLQFGAKGDGRTDDTAAVQAMFNSGKYVYFPPPAVHYLITSTIAVQPGTTIIGPHFPDRYQDARHIPADIRWAGPSASPMFRCGNGAGKASQTVEGITVIGLYISGDNVASSGFDLGTQRSRIIDCELRCFAGYGVYFEDSNVWAGENRIEGCLIGDFGIAGVRGGNYTMDSFLVDTVMGEISINDAHASNLNLYTDAGWLISGNHFMATSGPEVICTHTAGGRYIANDFDDPAGIGLSLTSNEPYNFTTIVGNTFETATKRRNIHLIDLKINTTCSININGNTFGKLNGDIGFIAINKSGKGMLLGTIGVNQYNNMMYNEELNVDRWTQVVPMMSYAAIDQDESAPTSGSWDQGAIVLNRSPAAGGYIGWVETAAGGGTFGTYSEGLTGTANGTTSITLSGASKVLQVGNWIAIHGATVKIVALDGASMTVSGNVASGSNLSIAYSTPVFKTFGHISYY